MLVASMVVSRLSGQVNEKTSTGKLKQFIEETINYIINNNILYILQTIYYYMVIR